MIQTPEARKRQIKELYCRQLRTVARLRFVWTFEMVNDDNRTEYFLCFGTNSPEGLSQMKQATWKADPLSGQVFSDRTDPGQLVITQAGGEIGLREVLRQQFRGKDFVSIGEIERFVLEQTNYSEKIHLKQRTLKPMEQTSPPAIEVRRPAGARRAAGQYPEGTQIKFL